MLQPQDIVDRRSKRAFTRERRASPGPVHASVRDKRICGWDTLAPSMRAAAFIVVGLVAVGCQEAPRSRAETGLETLGLRSVAPAVWLPGTTVQVEGSSFLDEPLGISWLRLSGTLDDRSIALDLPATFVDFDRLEVPIDDQALAVLGTRSGSFSGLSSVVVDFVPDGSRHQSPALSQSFELVESLQPELDQILDDGAIWVNDPIPVAGQGFLLGGAEGETLAIIEGCFLPEGGNECEDRGVIEIPVEPVDPFARGEGTFAFSPRIAGIHPGQFQGRVHLRNVHADGTVLESEQRPVVYDLLATTIMGIGPGGSLGQYVDIEGAGFVGGDEPGAGLTILRIEGEFFGDDSIGGVPVPPLDIIPEYVSGRQIRYVINEEDALGVALENQGGVRYAKGAFDGTVQAIVAYGGDELVGPTSPLTFRTEPVKQVVYVHFNPSYVESLRKFGLRALDQRIQERVLEVMERDYASVNVEFRTEEPEDFKLYSIVEIHGPDPNGLGLLGYDNTPGKDRNNERLFDRIGGVNALTQEDGYAGYGGVFIESIFTFSPHPIAGVSAEAPTPLFDQLFDPFRPDRGGTPVNSADEVGEGIPVLTNGNGCPTAGDRQLQAACAVWALGSLIGTTTSHEIGHSLGLADPVGVSFHNIGDGPNRLMDSGGGRPFEERAELMGQGPSLFCEQAYQYLRQILPTDEPETDLERPGC